VVGVLACANDSPTIGTAESIVVACSRTLSVHEFLIVRALLLLRCRSHYLLGLMRLFDYFGKLVRSLIDVGKYLLVLDSTLLL
jgi:hypothetical protein